MCLRHAGSCADSLGALGPGAERSPAAVNSGTLVAEFEPSEKEGRCTCSAARPPSDMFCLNHLIWGLTARRAGQGMDGLAANREEGNPMNYCTAPLTTVTLASS